VESAPGPYGASDQPPGRGWPRAAALFVVAMAASVVQPTVLVAAPLLIMVAVRGIRGGPLVLGAILAMVVVVSGPRDGFWYMERGWGILTGGCFVALSVAWPQGRLSSRLLGAVGGAFAIAGASLAWMGNGWATLDFSVTNAIEGGIGATLITAFARYEFESVSAILILIISTLFLAELVSGRLRRRLL